MTSLRARGSTKTSVGAVGLGCMGMSELYGPVEDARSIRVIRRALEVGVRLLDTADMYGQGHNEQLIEQAVRGRRDDAVLAITKCGIRRAGKRRWHDNGPSTFASPASSHCADST